MRVEVRTVQQRGIDVVEAGLRLESVIEVNMYEVEREIINERRRSWNEIRDLRQNEIEVGRIFY